MIAFLHRATGRLRDYPWGASSLFLLCVSVLSGITVSLQYDVADPFYSVVAMDLSLPFGLFWRSLHFYSSQLFFLFTAVHFVIVLDAVERRMTAGRWAALVFTLPVIVLLLFSGYVLRGDATGEAAGAIAENISLTVPLVGGMIDSLFFQVSAAGVRKVAAQHYAGLPFLWLLLSWSHVRRYQVDWAGHGVLLAALLLFCALVPAPMEPASLGTRHVNGPWFFLGVQELLRYAQPFWGGIAFPFVLVGGLLAIHVPERRQSWCRVVLAWLLLYAALSVVALTR
ncbi:MAG: hypothetical protein AB1568_11940 [Thermodesulfobacteriota bacterium]